MMPAQSRFAVAQQVLESLPQSNINGITAFSQPFEGTRKDPKPMLAAWRVE